MKYKIGDKVRIREDLVEGDKRFENGVEREMAALHGKKVTIAHSYGSGEYSISEDGEDYIWAGGMFSGYADFARDDLRSGMVVETRNRDRYLVLVNPQKIRLMRSNGWGFMHVTGGIGGGHSDDLRFEGLPGLDIMKVFDEVNNFDEVKTTTDLLWERKEPKKMTLSDVCKQLGYDVEIIPE